jgi:phosphonate transport system permease protein
MAESALVSRRWSKPPFIKDPRLRWGIGLGVAVYLALALGTMEIDWGRVAEGLPRGVKFIAAFFPPEVRRATWRPARSTSFAAAFWRSAVPSRR